MIVSEVDIQCRDFLFVSRSPYVLCPGHFSHTMKLGLYVFRLET